MVYSWSSSMTVTLSRLPGKGVAECAGVVMMGVGVTTVCALVRLSPQAAAMTTTKMSLGQLVLRHRVRSNRRLPCNVGWLVWNVSYEKVELVKLQSTEWFEFPQQSREKLRNGRVDRQGILHDFVRSARRHEVADHLNHVIAVIA